MYSNYYRKLMSETNLANSYGSQVWVLIGQLFNFFQAPKYPCHLRIDTPVSISASESARPARNQSV
ncbi:hypothetical protein EMIT0215P_360002 [Pseudomonas serboccidentalis]